MHPDKLQGPLLHRGCICWEVVHHCLSLLYAPEVAHRRQVGFLHGCYGRGVVIKQVDEVHVHPRQRMLQHIEGLSNLIIEPLANQRRGQCCKRAPWLGHCTAHVHVRQCASNHQCSYHWYAHVVNSRFDAPLQERRVSSCA